MTMRQLLLFPGIETNQAELVRTNFSHKSVCPEESRIALEERYGHLLQETDEFNRQLVSFQANKTEVLHSWIKYREGFSAALVERIIRKFGMGPGNTILDPFAGSCTTQLVAKMLGINAVGIELLPYNQLVWEAKSRAFDYDVNELRHIRKLAQDGEPMASDERFPHLTITQTAFPEQTERD